jgi:hypothetical protein
MSDGSEVAFVIVPVIMVLMFVGGVVSIVIQNQRNQADGVAYHAPPPAVISADPTHSHVYPTQSAGYHPQGSCPPSHPVGYHQPQMAVSMVPLPGAPQPVGYQPGGPVPMAPNPGAVPSAACYQPQSPSSVASYPTATVVYAEAVVDYKSTPMAPQPGGRW